MNIKQFGFEINQKKILGCLILIFLVASICIRSEGKDRNAGGYKRQARQSADYPHNNRVSAQRKTCDKGQYVNVTNGQCFPCKENTFNPDDNHTSEDCIVCKVESQYEILILPANGTHGPEFGCRGGYFIEEYSHGKPKCRNVKCGKCTNCSVSTQFEGQPCSNKSNAVCCQDKDMIVLGGECTSRQTTNATTQVNNTTSTPFNVECDKNQYLDRSNQTCQPCPLHTYMDKDNHTNNVCFNCSKVNAPVKPDGCPSDNDAEKDVDVGLIVGLIVGLGLGVLLMILLVWYLYKKGKCTAIESFRMNQGTRRNEFVRGEPVRHETYRFTQNGSMTLNGNDNLELSTV